MNGRGYCCLLDGTRFVSRRVPIVAHRFVQYGIGIEGLVEIPGWKAKKTTQKAAQTTPPPPGARGASGGLLRQSL